MNEKSNNEELSTNIIKKANISLIKASQWILRTFDSPVKSENASSETISDYGDLDGMSTIIPTLYTIAETGFFEIDPKYSEIIENHRNSNDGTSTIWINYYINKNREIYSKYLSRYIEILSAENPPEPWELISDEPIFNSCRNCPNRYVCLDLFKAILSSVFRKEMVLNNGIVMNEIFKSQIGDITKILKKQAIRENGIIVGYPHTITERNINAYASISILKFLNAFENESLLEFGEDIEEIHENIINKIENLQHKKSQTISRTFIGDTIDIKGSWDEDYWGKQNVNRIKSTSNIATMLYGLNGKSDVIKLSKEFVDNAFGGKNYTIDLVSFRDTFVSNVSDISGTISAIKFYLNVGDDYGLKPNSKDITTKIRWLINQQREDGAFPVLSKSLLNQYQETTYIRNNVKEENGHKKYNMSLPNTADSISLLSLFLNKLGAL